MTGQLSNEDRAGMGFTPSGVVFGMPEPSLSFAELAAAVSNGSRLLIHPSIRTPVKERVTLQLTNIAVWAVMEINPVTARYSPPTPISPTLSVFDPDGARFTGTLTAFSAGYTVNPAPLKHLSGTGFVRFNGSDAKRPKMATELWVQVDEMQADEALVRHLVELGPMLRSQ